MNAVNTQAAENAVNTQAAEGEQKQTGGSTEQKHAEATGEQKPVKEQKSAEEVMQTVKGWTEKDVRAHYKTMGRLKDDTIKTIKYHIKLLGLELDVHERLLWMALLSTALNHDPPAKIKCEG